MICLTTEVDLGEGKARVDSVYDSFVGLTGGPYFRLFTAKSYKFNLFFLQIKTLGTLFFTNLVPLLTGAEVGRGGVVEWGYILSSF